MRKKLKTAMTVVIAIQSAIEIAKFVGESYKSYKNRNKSTPEDEEDEEVEQTVNRPINVESR
ncbi:MAG: hypothetical protein SNJ29_11830 [Rikenellaceae bacterium]